MAAIGKDSPGKLQPGPAVYIPVTRCVQLDDCSDNVKGQPKLMLPFKSSCCGDISFGSTRGPFGPSLMLTERQSGKSRQKGENGRGQALPVWPILVADCCAFRKLAKA